MRKSVVLLGTLAGLTAAISVAQTPPPGSRDGTADVRSQGYNTPTPSLTDQLYQRQELQNLNQSPTADAGKLGRFRPAKKDELTVGAPINDKTGVLIAKIDSVAADGIVVSVGPAKVKVPAEAFGHNNAGLLLDMTKAQFQQVVAQASAAS